MMEAYVTEEQQVEAIKNWFKKYGNALSWVIFVILAIALVVKYWFHHQSVVAQQASNIYETLTLGIEQREVATIQNQAEKLITEEPKSTYATFAAYTLANEAIQEQQYDVAQKQLAWAVEQAKQVDLSGLAKIRLMRILISQDKLPQALALYDPKDEHAYMPIMEELRGDILLKQSDRDGARIAYQKAYESSPKEGMTGVFLKLKLEELGVDPNTLSQQVKSKAQ